MTNPPTKPTDKLLTVRRVANGKSTALVISLNLKGLGITVALHINLLKES